MSTSLDTVHSRSNDEEVSTFNWVEDLYEEEKEKEEDEEEDEKKESTWKHIGERFRGIVFCQVIPTSN